MARIRSVHPGLFTDESFVALSAAAQILLIGLWTEADDNGVFEWKPGTIKLRLLPAASVDIEALLEELLRADCIRKVEAAGRAFGLVRDFALYQKPRRRVVQHPLSADHYAYVGHCPSMTDGVGHCPPKADGDGHCPTKADGDGHCPPERREEERREVERRETGGERRGEDAPPRDLPGAMAEDAVPAWPGVELAMRLPADWTITDAMRRWAEQEAPDVDLDRETAQFVDHWIAKPGEAGVSLDWERVWRKWMRKAQDELPRGRISARSSGDDDAQWQRRLEGFAANALWLETWGERPGLRLCQAPVALLKQFGFAEGEAR